MSIVRAFNESATTYDEWVQKALPNYSEIFSVAKEIIPFADDEKIKVLDLGAGTGLFSRHVFEQYPQATFVLYDVAAEMLEVARQRFQGSLNQFQLVVDDYRNLEELERFDLVISSLSIHHLADNEKQHLFAKVFAALRKNGLFINIDQIRGPTPYLQELYWTKWLEKVRQKGAAEEKISQSIQRRLAFDKDASLDEQLKWLGEVGFLNVDCVYKNYFIGVMMGTKGQPDRIS